MEQKYRKVFLRKLNDNFDSGFISFLYLLLKNIQAIERGFICLHTQKKFLAIISSWYLTRTQGKKQLKMKVVLSLYIEK